ncbi:uncharacterized protein LOC109432949 [Aedes albopictus]|uniref:MARVEL domain-containing protein n=1 Tax=Aedes albopictus TaxID=7160 RepID=A0ABM1ZIY5_AEDAL|nr:uncharacterized protein LOC109432949 [Aedes albopictus]KXJ69254.1 hypothetical protein RP20_CCG028074 [Aedes albopictus]
MSKISTVGSPPAVHNSDHKDKTSNPLEFPLNNDVTILQSPAPCPDGPFDWKVLKTVRSALKLGQITAAIVILALTRTRSRRNSEPLDSLAEMAFLFLAINALIGTVLSLADSILIAHPLRKAFTPVLWFRVKLWLTGLAAVAFHTLAYFVLVIALNYYGYESNIVAAAFGFFNAGLYLVDWWLDFSKRHEIVRNLENTRDFEDV